MMDIVVDKYFKLPFRYESYGQYIVDSDNNIFLNIRGYGRIVSITKSDEEAETAQDEIANWVVQALNEKILNDLTKKGDKI